MHEVESFSQLENQQYTQIVFWYKQIQRQSGTHLTNTPLKETSSFISFPCLIFILFASFPEKLIPSE